jgi:hypothetical protein
MERNQVGKNWTGGTIWLGMGLSYLCVCIAVCASFSLVYVYDTTMTRIYERMSEALSRVSFISVKMHDLSILLSIYVSVESPQYKAPPRRETVTP